jgi:hypothetical protein
VTLILMRFNDAVPTAEICESKMDMFCEQFGSLNSSNRQTVEENNESLVRIADNLTEIRTMYFSHKKLERYYYINLLINISRIINYPVIYFPLFSSVSVG